MKTIVNLHSTQLHILEQLRTNPKGLRYAQMKPANIENDLYNYHLQYLVKSNFVFKTYDKYSLNDDGKKYLMELNPLDQFEQTSRFKLASAALLIRGHGSGTELLYQKRGRQPFVGQVEIIAGGIKRGEPVTAAARRRLKEEAGLVASFRLLGLLRKTFFDTKDQVYSDILFHICVSTNFSGRLIEQNQFGEQLWLPVDEAATIESTKYNCSKKFAQILQQLALKPIDQIPLFYIEEVYRHDIY